MAKKQKQKKRKSKPTAKAKAKSNVSVNVTNTNSMYVKRIYSRRQPSFRDKQSSMVNAVGNAAYGFPEFYGALTNNAMNAFQNQRYGLETQIRDLRAEADVIAQAGGDVQNVAQQIQQYEGDLDDLQRMVGGIDRRLDQTVQGLARINRQQHHGAAEFRQPPPPQRAAGGGRPRSVYQGNIDLAGGAARCGGLVVGPSGGDRDLPQGRVASGGRSPRSPSAAGGGGRQRRQAVGGTPASAAARRTLFGGATAQQILQGPFSPATIQLRRGGGGGRP